jgi:hypothetical protein
LLPLKLEAMLDDAPEHCTERRGCGYTQSTRFIASRINQPADALSAADLGLLGEWSAREVMSIGRLVQQSGCERGWRALCDQPGLPLEFSQMEGTAARLSALDEQLAWIATRLSHEESLLLLELLQGVVLRRGSALPRLPGCPEKPAIGSCSQAEEFFLELAHGRVRRGGSVNLFVAEDGRPLLLEKMNLGESHSAISLQPLVVNGVEVPAGASWALRHAPTIVGTATRHGHVFPWRSLSSVHFLRLTTLAVSPASRRRAFTCQLDRQLQQDMLSPATSSLDDLRSFAQLLQSDAA